MTDVRVLIADAMDPRAAAIFRERGIHVDENIGLGPDELAAIIGSYDGLAVRSSTRVTAAILDAALPRLKVIGRGGGEPGHAHRRNLPRGGERPWPSARACPQAHGRATAIASLPYPRAR